MSKRPKEADLSLVRTHSIEGRASKVALDDLGCLFDPSGPFDRFLAALPRQLAAPDLLELAGAIARARRRESPVVLMFGGHVVKCGLSPFVADLVRRGIVTQLATNGSGAIHDLELAFFGATSEDVASRLDDGTFGFARETAELFADGAGRAVKGGIGLGAGLGRVVAGAPNREISLLHVAAEEQVPFTVHVALGAEIVHQHPGIVGAELGEASLRDFRILAGGLAGLDGDAVVLNVGSSVVLPEVFLKALTVARNLGAAAHGFTAANLDMNRPYRSIENVVRRPTRTGGRGIHITGHHEIMIPLLYGAVLAAIARGEDDEDDRCSTP